jgi:hypothetical protein
VEECSHGIIWGTIPAFTWRLQRKLWNTSVCISGPGAKIWTQTTKYVAMTSGTTNCMPWKCRSTCIRQDFSFFPQRYASILNRYIPFFALSCKEQPLLVLTSPSEGLMHTVCTVYNFLHRLETGYTYIQTSHLKT